MVAIRNILAPITTVLGVVIIIHTSIHCCHCTTVRSSVIPLALINLPLLSLCVPELILLVLLLVLRLSHRGIQHPNNFTMGLSIMHQSLVHSRVGTEIVGSLASIQLKLLIKVNDHPSKAIRTLFRGFDEDVFIMVLAIGIRLFNSIKTDHVQTTTSLISNWKDIETAIVKISSQQEVIWYINRSRLSMGPHHRNCLEWSPHIPHPKRNIKRHVNHQQAN
uniref:Secreted protein n=1 Tax=Rodentolepis nana TaxID=102285 RepID=A0A0R3TJP3_RODNA